ncbi:MAG: transposase [Roseovarius sp.]
MFQFDNDRISLTDFLICSPASNTPHHEEIVGAVLRSILGEFYTRCLQRFAVATLRSWAKTTVDRLFHRPRPSARRRRKKGGEDHAIGRSRGGLSTKIHAVVDQDGLPVRLHITAGQASDKTVAPVLLDALPPGTVIADRGYDSLALVERVAARGGLAHIPTQSRVRRQRSVPRDLYRRRSTRVSSNMVAIN